MTEKIEVKLCSNQNYEAFIKEHSIDTFLQPQEDFVERTLAFIEQLPTYHIEKDNTVADLLKLVWHDDEFVDQSTDELVFKNSDNLIVVRAIYCPQLGGGPVPITKILSELYYKNNLVLYYKQDRYLQASRSRQWGISLNRSETWIRTYDDCVVNRLPDPVVGSQLRGLVISASDESNSFNTVLRKDFGSLMAAAGRRLDLTFLEKENSYWDKSFLEYWEAELELPGQFEAESFAGHTSSMPYSKHELQEVLADIEGITGSPQLLLFRNLSEGYILLDIDNDFKGFFDRLIRAIVYTAGRIGEGILALKTSIESSLDLVELPEYQSEPGSRARMQEALAHAKAKRVQEQQGRVAPENVYSVVNKIFKKGGRGLESFEHFKGQFLTYYADFQNGSDHLLPGDNAYHTKLQGLAVGKNLENEAYRSVLMQRLTQRDIEVLKLMGQGKTIQEIADALILVRFTVHTLRKNILRKLDLEYSKDLVRFAKMIGLSD